MEYIFKPGIKGKPVFVLLHGTGGDERDLLPLAEMLDKDYGVLSVRGQEPENGMNRFFKRTGMGQYDLENLDFRGRELLDFVKEQAEKNDFNVEDAIFVGFSNGSNIAINMLLREDANFKRAILFAPLYSIELDDKKDLSGLDVFISMGKNDPMASMRDNETVIELFKSRGARVEEYWVNGHELTGDAVMAANYWLNK